MEYEQLEDVEKQNAESETEYNEPLDDEQARSGVSQVENEDQDTDHDQEPEDSKITVDDINDNDSNGHIPKIRLD